MTTPAKPGRGGARAGAGRRPSGRAAGERLAAPRLTAAQAEQLAEWVAACGWPVATLTRRALGLEPGPWPMQVGPGRAVVYDDGLEVARAQHVGGEGWAVVVRRGYMIRTSHGPTIREAYEAAPAT
mgnify:CR=1 FL=1